MNNNMNPFTQPSNLDEYAQKLADNKWSEFLHGVEGNKRALTAILLENQNMYFGSMDEATRTAHIGNFERYAFPLIRTVFPNLIATEIVSVQPMLGPSSLVFYLEYGYGKSKGQIRKGDKVFDATDSTYSSETIRQESAGTVLSSTSVVLTNFAYTPVKPGTVALSDGGGVVKDDGNGNLIGDCNAGGYINYVTGEASFTPRGNVWTAGAAIFADYEYNSEGNDDIPEIDMILTSSPVVARKRKLKAKWSLEAAINLKAVHGMDAESELAALLADEIKFELDREIIEDLSRFAANGPVVWSKSTGPGVSWTEHKLSLIDKFVEASNLIFKSTRRAQGNFIVAGTEVCNIVEALPGFIAAQPGTMGVMKIGVLQGRWTVYKDPYMKDTEFVVGHKGMTFLDSGYIYCPYIPLYTTPTVVLDDFVGRKGVGTQYGKKLINSKFYCRGLIQP